MIETSSLLAQSSASASTYLTPLWILSMGVLLGTVIVAILFVVLWAVSRLPVIGDIYDNVPVRRIAGIVLGLIFTGLGVGFVIVPLFGTWSESEGGMGTAITNAALLAVAMIPLAFVLGFGILALVSRRAMDDLIGGLTEGFLFWFSGIAILVSLFGIVGYGLSMMSGVSSLEVVKSPNDKLESLLRLSASKYGELSEFEIPADNGTGTLIDIEFESVELRALQFQADQRLEVAVEEITNDIEPQKIIPVDESAADDEWMTYFGQTGVGGPIPQGKITNLYIRNLGDASATLRIKLTTQPEYPQVSLIPWVAGSIVVLFMAYFIQRTAMPKVSAIALSTFKTEVAQPIYLLFILLGSLFAFASIYIPYYTLGEDIKMLKDAVLTVILVFSIFMAVWAASKSIAEEIEGRTALTVLSKPIGRRDFILGKFLGISWSTGLLYIVMGLVFLVVVSYKPVYDARENSEADIYWQQCFVEMMTMVPALVLAFLEAIVFVAISVAISTRLPIMANLLLCFGIYVLGHLTPLIVQSSVAIEAFEPVVFFGQLIATIVPVLDHFNVQAALTGGATVPLVYLGWAFIYCLIYAAIAMLLALVMFEDRDLA